MRELVSFTDESLAAVLPLSKQLSSEFSEEEESDLPKVILIFLSNNEDLYTSLDEDDS